MPVPAAPEATAGARRAVLTVPNLFSTVRLCCIPVFVVLVAAPDRRHWFAAAALLAVLGATDWVDGRLARSLHQVSTLGKVLDPLADRLLLLTAVVTILAVGAVPVPVAVASLLREVVVAGGFLTVAVLGGRRMDVSFVGKAGTFAMMCAWPLFLAGHSTIGVHRALLVAAWAVAIPGLVVSWSAAVGYIPGALRAIAEGRRGGGRR